MTTQIIEIPEAAYEVVLIGAVNTPREYLRSVFVTAGSLAEAREVVAPAIEKGERWHLAGRLYDYEVISLLEDGAEIVGA